MVIDPTQIDPQLLERVLKLASERHCSVDELLAAVLDHFERPARSANSLSGLFADDPDLVDKLIEDVHQTRQRGVLRHPGHD